MDRRVVLEAAVPVYGVETVEEAVQVAISKTGALLNPDLSYVEIETSNRPCAACGEAGDAALVVADEALVALELEMVVFNVDRDEHAARVARGEIGSQLPEIPLDVVAVTDADREA